MAIDSAKVTRHPLRASYLYDLLARGMVTSSPYTLRLCLFHLRYHYLTFSRRVVPASSECHDRGPGRIGPIPSPL